MAIIRRICEVCIRPKLLLKLEAYGITGDLLRWCAAFLGDRRQQVRVGSTFSSDVIVRSGVPQGSVLGAPFFLLYINDLPSISAGNCDLRLLANDVKIFGLTNTPTEQQNFLQTMDSLAPWCDDWQMTVSAGKCSSLLLGPMVIFWRLM